MQRKPTRADDTLVSNSSLNIVSLEIVALVEGWAQQTRLQRQRFAFAKERLNFAMPPIQRS